MKYTQDEIIEMIKNTILEVTGVRIVSDTDNLLDTKYDINPAEYLYVFDVLEKKLQLPVTDIFKDSDYTIMQPDHLCKAFADML